MPSDRDVLPDNVKPVNYSISLFDLKDSEPWTYQGSVHISLQVKTSTKSITLNAFQLKIHSAEVSSETGKTESLIKASDISYDVQNQRCTVSFDQALQEGSKAVLSITFEGTMNNIMAGFYRSKYKPVTTPTDGVAREGDDCYMFSTQFESSDARRAFPCFDEPNLKATFDFEIEIPERLTALSNMPEKEVRKGKASGKKVVSFDQTPIMSTYLLAWAFGDFEYIEDFTRRKYKGKSLPVRVYTTRGLKDQGKLALDSSHKIVDYFSDIFQIDYPLPKIDLLAVHEFSHGAMENWGLITYRTTTVLFDEEKSDQKYRNRVVYVCAHELSHMFFGNLVTMDWWNELWLNEGFATWVGWYAVAYLYPDWNTWGQFVTESMQMAFELDSLRTSHPIEVPVKNALEVDQIFDHISYLKGSSVIRMLASYLGVDVFLKGVAAYLAKHQYGNATTNDLWAALSKASGQDVAAFMGPWINKIGFPVVTVAEEPGQVGVKQNRFLSTGDVKPEEDETTWWIPITFKSQDKKWDALTIKESTYREVDTNFYKINADHTGFYRVNLPPQRLVQLGGSLNKLSVEDKVGLIGDAAAMAQAGLGHTSTVLSFLEGFSSETDYFVWVEVLSTLTRIQQIFTDKEVAEGLQRFKLKLISPAVEKIGWKFPAKESFLTSQLRSLLITQAGLVGHEGTVSEAQKRFDDYFNGSNKSTMHPSLRLPIFKICIKNGDKTSYEQVKKEHLSTTSIDGTEITVQAMGQVPTPALARDYLDFAFSDNNVAVQNLHFMGGALTRNIAVRDEVWYHLKNNWAKVEKLLGANAIVLERYIRVTLQELVSPEIEKEIGEFFKDKDIKGYDRGLAVARDRIRSNVAYAKRDADVLKEWLVVHKYI
ncbi:aminopeptidase-like protein [Piedraia hortae CBS 480.64]|uniref:Aminopeptidase n=1 Tax=Piedraia hortae CBS 480.64 TaxID=1314780 RepID=A0A6A7C0X2_9PEZI|nr:aminopeptidase-like protein [Piedraia hortae CBS 480.64]